MRTADLHEIDDEVFEIVCKGCCKHENESFSDEPCKSCKVNLKSIKPNNYIEA